jgi:hypothetical protein
MCDVDLRVVYMSCGSDQAIAVYLLFLDPEEIEPGPGSLRRSPKRSLCVSGVMHTKT